MRVDFQNWADDLLMRQPFQLPAHSLKHLVGKRFLVTGGAGSIGSMLVEKLVSLQPATVIVLDNAEDRLYALQRQHGKSSSVQYVLGDINFREDLNRVCRKHRPHIVFHAAAHKYIDFLEAQPFAAVRTNVFGTRNVLEESADGAAVRIVVLSSDKASSPVSVLGATKRLSELLTLQCSNASVCVVRLCNVLGSAGSLLPLIKEQMRSGTVKVTDNAAERYFISPREAADLLLSAASVDQRGILIPAHSSRLNIRKLVESIIADAPAEHVQIEVTGLRPGERLSEELYSSGENVEASAEGLLKLTGSRPRARLELSRLEQALYKRDGSQVIEEMQLLLPEYRPANSTVIPLAT